MTKTWKNSKFKPPKAVTVTKVPENTTEKMTAEEDRKLKKEHNRVKQEQKKHAKIKDAYESLQKRRKDEKQSEKI